MKPRRKQDTLKVYKYFKGKVIMVFNEKEYQKKYYKEHIEEIKKRSSKYRKEHPEYIKKWFEEHRKEAVEYQRKYCKTHPERVKEYYEKNFGKKKEYKRKWCKENPEKVREYNKKCYKKHIIKMKEYAMQYRKNHSEKLREYRKKYDKEHLEKWREYRRRSRSTPKGKIDSRMSSSIYQSLRRRKGGKKWETLVGYTVADLKNHLQNKFVDGMTWAKFMASEIHIDHVVPQIHFKYTTPEDPQFKECWGLHNLQPLWAKDNLSKGNRNYQLPLMLNL